MLQAVTTATTAYRKSAFTVAAKNLASLWVTPNALRDHLLAQIDGEKLDFITINSKTHPEISLRNEGGSWYLLRHGKWDAANGERREACGGIAEIAVGQVADHHHGRAA